MSTVDQSDMIHGLDTYKINSLVNSNQGVFQNGITKNPLSYYEDPTYLGFTVEIDEQSAFFTECKDFIINNSQHKDIKARLDIYNNLVKIIKMVFNSQESADESTASQYIKQHYINQISGLQSLTKKFVKFKEDKLTVEMAEDVTLFTTFLATAYNNLIYSYDSGRILIPENLLYFNLYIKFSEVRNLTSIRQLASTNASDLKIARALKKNSTCMIYKLTDCLFNFFEAVPFGDAVAQSGIDTPNVAHSIVTFDIFFKRVNLILNTPLTPYSMFFDNREPGLALKQVSLTIPEIPNNTEPVQQSPQQLTNNNQNNINDDLIKNEGDVSLAAQNAYLGKDELEPVKITVFQNSGNKGASSVSSQNVENVTNLSEYENVMKQLTDWNTDPQTLPTNQFTSESTQVTNADGTVSDLTQADILNSGNVGKPNYTNQNKESKKNWVRKTSDTWNQIRSANNAVTDFYKSKNSQLNGVVTDKFGSALGGTVNSVINTVSNSALQALQKYEKLLLQKKNEILNQFLYQVKSQGKILLDYNVYTDPVDPMWQAPLQDLYNTMGNTVVDQLMGVLKDGTNTNIFGGGQSGSGL